MASFRCGNCNEQTHFTPVNVGQTLEPKDAWQSMKMLAQQALECDMCKLQSIAYTICDRTSYPPESPYEWKQFWENHDPYKYSPTPLDTADFENAPDHINAAAKEAHQVFSIGAYRSTAILCRATLEAICKDKEAEGKDLFKKIDDLYDKGKIRFILKETAHVLRAIGNDMAHGDFDSELETEDASDILDFLDSIINELYESPAQLARMQANIKSRKEALKESQ